MRLELRRTNWLFRWAYLMAPRPYTTTLFSLFWRSVLVTPLQIIGLAAFVSLLMTQLLMEPLPVVWFVLGVVGGVGGPLAIIFLCCEISDRFKEWRSEIEDADAFGYKPNVPSIARRVFTIKRRFCPLVDIRS